MKIMSKILLPLTALLIIPALLFLPFLQLEMSGSVVSAQSLGLQEYNSIYSIIQAANDGDSQLASYIKLIKEASGNGSVDIKEMLPSFNWIYGAAACLVLLLVCMLLIVFFSIFSKKKLLNVLFGGAGLLATGLLGTCFNKFAEPLLDGRVSVSSILSKITSSSTSEGSADLSGVLSGLSDTLSDSLGINLSGLANSLVGFKTLALSFATDAVMLVFVIVIILAFVFYMSLKNEDTGRLPG